MFKYFILFLIFLFSYQKEFPTDWVLKKNKTQIKVYLRNLDYNSKQYYAETIIEADINSVSSHILDFNNSFKWMYKLKSSEILSKEEELTLADYKKFIKLQDMVKTEEEKFKFSWLAEGIYQRLPEIAEKEGNYDFVKDGEF